MNSKPIFGWFNARCCMISEARRCPRRWTTVTEVAKRVRKSARDWFRRNIWNPAIECSGIDLHVTPHALRHAHASWLLADGADIQVVKDRLGHGSIITTQNYLHTLPGADESALKAMDAIRGVRTAAPALAGPGQSMLSAEQLAEYEALKKAKEQDCAGGAVLEVGGEQMVITAEEYAELEQLRAKMDAMKAAFAS